MVQEGQLKDKVLTVQLGFELNGIKLILRVQYSIINNDSFIVQSSRSTDEGKNMGQDRNFKISPARINQGSGRIYLSIPAYFIATVHLLYWRYCLSK
jgi:hypothetical protein